MPPLGGHLDLRSPAIQPSGDEGRRMPPLGGTWISARPPSSQAWTKEEECPPWGGTWISARPPSSQAWTKEEECPPWGAPGSPLAAGRPWGGLDKARQPRRALVAQAAVPQLRPHELLAAHEVVGEAGGDLEAEVGVDLV